MKTTLFLNVWRRNVLITFLVIKYKYSEKRKVWSVIKAPEFTNSPVKILCELHLLLSFALKGKNQPTWENGIKDFWLNLHWFGINLYSVFSRNRNQTCPSQHRSQRLNFDKIWIAFCLCRAEFCKSALRGGTSQPQICQWGVSLTWNIPLRTEGLENNIVKQTQQVLAGEHSCVRIQ